MRLAASRLHRARGYRRARVSRVPLACACSRRHRQRPPTASARAQRPRGRVGHHRRADSCALDGTEHRDLRPVHLRDGRRPAAVTGRLARCIHRPVQRSHRRAVHADLDGRPGREQRAAMGAGDGKKERAALVPRRQAPRVLRRQHRRRQERHRHRQRRRHGASAAGGRDGNEPSAAAASASVWPGRPTADRSRSCPRRPGPSRRWKPTRSSSRATGTARVSGLAGASTTTAASTSSSPMSREAGHAAHRRHLLRALDRLVAGRQVARCSSPTASRTRTSSSTTTSSRSMSPHGRRTTADRRRRTTSSDPRGRPTASRSPIQGLERPITSSETNMEDTHVWMLDVASGARTRARRRDRQPPRPPAVVTRRRVPLLHGAVARQRRPATACRQPAAPPSASDRRSMPAATSARSLSPRTVRSSPR